MRVQVYVGHRCVKVHVCDLQMCGGQGVLMYRCVKVQLCVRLQVCKSRNICEDTILCGHRCV